MKTTKNAAKRPVIAVVSAMSKITDLLLDTTRHAEAGEGSGRTTRAIPRRSMNDRRGPTTAIIDACVL